VNSIHLDCVVEAPRESAHPRRVPGLRPLGHIQHLLKRKSSDLSPARTLALLSTLHSADIILPTTDGREIRLRRITTPNPEQQRLLDQLGIILPERLSFDSECSVASATA
jgi:hypothetical protein